MEFDIVTSSKGRLEAAVVSGSGGAKLRRFNNYFRRRPAITGSKEIDDSKASKVITEFLDLTLYRRE